MRLCTECIYRLFHVCSISSSHAWGGFHDERVSPVKRIHFTTCPVLNRWGESNPFVRSILMHIVSVQGNHHTAAATTLNPNSMAMVNGTTTSSTGTAAPATATSPSTMTAASSKQGGKNERLCRNVLIYGCVLSSACHCSSHVVA